jgi:hypothetical protein
MKSSKAKWRSEAKASTFFFVLFSLITAETSGSEEDDEGVSSDKAAKAKGEVPVPAKQHVYQAQVCVSAFVGMYGFGMWTNLCPQNACLGPYASVAKPYINTVNAYAFKTPLPKVHTLNKHAVCRCISFNM